MTTNTNAALAEDLQDTVSKALRRAWQLGQTYWQQADSEYTSQHRKADETQGKFDTLVEETRAALSTAAQPPALTGDPAEPRDDSDRIYDRPVGYLPAYELSRLHSGHGAQLRSAKFGPSALDGDVPVYLESSALALVQALIGAQRAINSMKAEAETAAQGDEQMMLDACEQISNEGLEASLAIQAALSTAAQPPADGALNTIAAMFHSGEEIEGPDGLAIMVDMALWNDALDSFEVIIGDEMEPAKEQA